MKDDRIVASAVFVLDDLGVRHVRRMICDNKLYLILLLVNNLFTLKLSK